MGAAEQRTRSQAMAADLLRRGIWHGKRTTVTHAPAIPDPTQVGSAAYRRLVESRRAKAGGTK